MRISFHLDRKREISEPLSGGRENILAARVKGGRVEVAVVKTDARSRGEARSWTDDASPNNNRVLVSRCVSTRIIIRVPCSMLSGIIRIITPSLSPYVHYRDDRDTSPPKRNPCVAQLCTCHLYTNAARMEVKQTQTLCMTSSMPLKVYGIGVEVSRLWTAFHAPSFGANVHCHIAVYLLL